MAFKLFNDILQLTENYKDERGKVSEYMKLVEKLLITTMAKTDDPKFKGKLESLIAELPKAYKQIRNNPEQIKFEKTSELMLRSPSKKIVHDVLLKALAANIDSDEPDTLQQKILDAINNDEILSLKTLCNEIIESTHDELIEVVTKFTASFSDLNVVDQEIQNEKMQLDDPEDVLDTSGPTLIM